MSASSFFEHYDLLYSEKDYAKEARIVFDSLRKKAERNVLRILDIGCGTGRHAIELAKFGVEIYAFDVEPAAIKVAKRRKHDKNITFGCGSIETLPENNFDGAVSLFNVINYILEEHQLDSFFRALRSHLKPSSPFLFDCWNGYAALNDPPRVKTSEVSSGASRARMTIHPCLMPVERRVRIDMDISIEEGTGHKTEFTTSYMHRLWTSEELIGALTRNGFADIQARRWMSHEMATNRDWKIMFSSIRL